MFLENMLNFMEYILKRSDTGVSKIGFLCALTK